MSLPNHISACEWISGLSFTAYGRRLRICVNDPAVLQIVPKHLPYGWRPGKCGSVERTWWLYRHPRKRGTHVLFDAAGQVAESRQLPNVLEAFEREARLFVARHARDRIFIHAAAVEWQ